jgi:hypothetical protein
LSTPKQKVFPFDAKGQELPEAAQQRVRELLGQMLLAVVTHIDVREGGSDEREDSATPSGATGLRVCTPIDDEPSA